MFYLIGILVILYIALRLVQKRNLKDLNHRKSFNVKYTKSKNNSKS